MLSLCEETRTLEGLAAAVSRAYARLQQTPQAEMAERFRGGRSRLLLIRALQMAAPPREALVIGCGSGYAGGGPGYARDVVEAVWPEAHVETLALTPETRELGSHPYDLVVTHSLLHFMPSPEPFCARLESVVRAGSAYVMAHEPNRRFWRNPSCRQAAAAWHRGEALRRRFDPRRIAAALLRRLKRGHPAPPMHDLVNEELRHRYWLHPPLSAAEVRHLVDPWMPAAGTEGGFDVDSLGAGWLRGFELRWSAATDWLGDADAVLRPRWWRLDAELMRACPSDGACLTALWERRRS